MDDMQKTVRYFIKQRLKKRTGEILANVRNKVRISGIQDELPKVKARKRGIQRARTDSEDCKPPAISTFLEVFVVLAKRNEYVFPIATALLPNKRAITYRIFFQMLHQVFPQLNPQGISCDYELVIQNAARGEWEDVSIDGCYWHLCSNLYKHLEKEGLSVRYDSDVQFSHECRKIVALACVPILHLDECFASLKKNLPVSLSSILDCFENYYLGPMQPNGIRRLT